MQIALVCAAAFIYGLFKKRFDSVLLGCAVFILTTCIVSVLGTCGDYARTALAVLPFVFTGLASLAGQGLTLFKNSIEKKENIENV